MVGGFVCDDGVGAVDEKCLERRAARSVVEADTLRAMPDDEDRADEEAEKEGEEEEEEGEGEGERGGREERDRAVGGARVSRQQRAVPRQRVKGAPADANWVRRRRAADVAARNMGDAVGWVWFRSGLNAFHQV